MGKWLLLHQPFIKYLRRGKIQVFMSSQVSVKIKSFGTAPVFFTALTTLFGAILFLRFGYAA